MADNIYRRRVGSEPITINSVGAPGEAVRVSVLKMSGDKLFFRFDTNSPNAAHNYDAPDVDTEKTHAVGQQWPHHEVAGVGGEPITLVCDGGRADVQITSFTP